MDKSLLIKFITEHNPQSSREYLEQLSIENLVILKVGLELEIEQSKNSHGPDSFLNFGAILKQQSA